jgi:hypothetical protein
LSWVPESSSFGTLFGVPSALRMVKDSVTAISEIADFVSKHGIDADFRRGGCRGLQPAGFNFAPGRETRIVLEYGDAIESRLCGMARSPVNRGRTVA